MVVNNGGLTSKMLVLMGLIGNLYGIYMGCLDYLLVNIQKALENGHRNSEFSHEHGDFPSFFVRLPEGITYGESHREAWGLPGTSLDASHAHMVPPKKTL
jgi:hypothetical protein